MKRVFSEDIGASKLIIAQNADGYVGTIWQGGQARETIEHADLKVLKASLRNLAGTLHPDYFGIEGAKGRFCSFFPGGFTDATYLAKERDYKDKARSALNIAVPSTGPWKRMPVMPSVAARALRPIFCRALKPRA